MYLVVRDELGTALKVGRYCQAGPTYIYAQVQPHALVVFAPAQDNGSCH
jgi:hypothetical protein